MKSSKSLDFVKHIILLALYSVSIFFIYKEHGITLALFMVVMVFNQFSLSQELELYRNGLRLTVDTVSEVAEKHNMLLQEVRHDKHVQREYAKSSNRKDFN